MRRFHSRSQIHISESKRSLCRPISCVQLIFKEDIGINKTTTNGFMKARPLKAQKFHTVSSTVKDVNLKDMNYMLLQNTLQTQASSQQSVTAQSSGRFFIQQTQEKLIENNESIMPSNILGESINEKPSQIQNLIMYIKKSDSKNNVLQHIRKFSRPSTTNIGTKSSPRLFDSDRKPILNDYNKLKFSKIETEQTQRQHKIQFNKQYYSEGKKTTSRIQSLLEQMTPLIVENLLDPQMTDFPLTADNLKKLEYPNQEFQSIVELSSIPDQNINQNDLDLKQKKIIQFDPDILQEMKDEINGATSKVDKHIADNERFFKELFAKEPFPFWLRTSDATLTNQELQYVREAFLYKHQLLDEDQSIEDIDFDVIDSIVAKLAFFERFTKSTRINILKLAKYQKMNRGEYVFRQGDIGDNLYIILKGCVTVKVARQGSVEQVVASLYDGQHFGELAIMESREKNDEDQLCLEEKIKQLNVSDYKTVKQQLNQIDKLEKEKEKALNENKNKFYIDTPEDKKEVIQIKRGNTRTASIVASETLDLLSIGKENFQNILMVLMQEELEIKIKMLKSLRFFSDIQPFVLIPLANQLVPREYVLDQVVIREGDPIQEMFILFRGSCNVVRQIDTKRQVQAQIYSKGTIKQLESFKYDQRRQITQKERFGQPGPNQEVKCHYVGETDRVTEYELKNKDNEYKRSYVYRRLFPGEVIFTRAITQRTLEGEAKPDKARMTIVSTSQNTLLYSVTWRLLQFCPDFLISHIINSLVTMQDVDYIQKQPLNKQRKLLEDALFKPPNVQEAERKLNKSEARKIRLLKQQEKEKLGNIPIKKIQNEKKQDLRNMQWEKYKEKLVLDSVYDNGNQRLLYAFKKY